LETVRQYSRDRLVELGESDRLRTTHLDFFLRQAEAVHNLNGPAGEIWQERMITEHDNTRAALEWSWRADALHVAGLMANYQGDFEYGMARLEESMALRRELGDQERLISSLNELGFALYRQGDYARAAALLEESLGLIRGLGDKAPLSLRLSLRTRTTYFLGIVERLRGDYAQAERLGRESLALSRELGPNGTQ
jgi:tetratricopeptide (TPR) repeat protein